MPAPSGRAPPTVRPSGGRPPGRAPPSSRSNTMADTVFVLLTIAVFALVGVVARGVTKL
ncbi:hypothetical protein [Allostreptomyces psammosilenae]|uniref:Uncharacterized protein n=1 Tax=Allostreptomyces psammosilenae TaxID=1892865 RepID=A0A852ZL92_9ACTN|nr:hypothetical protein [Allostreptomyces psammosilenae]NYI03146.1 hypothetical protein [Allostreptomyces psammosilenae]